MKLARSVVTVGLLGLVGLGGAVLGACSKNESQMDHCGEVLPEEGSLCPKDGEVCAPDRDGCGLYRGLRCDAGAWVSFEVGTGECDVDSEAIVTDGDTELAPVACEDEVPPDATPCENEGEDCAPDPDECAGYLGAQCSAGFWMRYEVEPGDHETCSETGTGSDTGSGTSSGESSGSGGA